MVDGATNSYAPSGRSVGLVPVTAAGGTTARTLADRFADIANVLDGGADDTGATDSAAAFSAALARSRRVYVPAGTYSLGSTVEVPAGCELLLDPNCTLKPSTDANVIKIHAGGWLEGGTIDTSDISFSSNAIDIDGDDEGDATVFRLFVKSGFDNVALLGGDGAGTGNAVSLHADGITNARILGVFGRAKVQGFENAIYMRQTSTDLSKFVNSCYLDIQCGASWRALLMESSHASGYGISGNFIRIQHQPNTSATQPSCTIVGQLNDFEIIAWDWDTVAGTAATAITIGSGVRQSSFKLWVSPSYVTNNSSNDIHVVNYLAPWAIDYDSGGDLQVKGGTSAGDNIILNARNSTGSVFLRRQGSNLFSVGTAGQVIIYGSTGSKQAVIEQDAAHSGTVTYTLPVVGGDFAVISQEVALGGGSAATLGTIGGDGPATAGQDSWQEITLPDGSAAWVPVWK